MTEHIAMNETYVSVTSIEKFFKFIALFSYYSTKGAPMGPRGFGDLGRRAIYFQGAREHC